LFINIYDYLRKQDAKFVFLILSMAVLPSLEAPKNLFILFFIFSWALIAIRDKNWGGNWRLIDTIFCLWIVADIAVGLNAIFYHDLPANGSKDILKFVLFGWVISRSGFDSKQIFFLVISTLIFSVIPLIESYTNSKHYIELHSVGHVNHTAIYLLISYILSLTFLVLNFRNLINSVRIILTIISFILALVVIDTNSRAASGILVIFSVLVLIYLIFNYKKRSVTIGALLFALCTISLVIINPPTVIDKFINGTHLIGDSPRQKIRNHAYYTFRTSPILGVGFGNYVHFGHDDIKDLVMKEKGEYVKENFLPGSHPHNVFYTYLVSGGVVMLSVFMIFWLYFSKLIYQVYKSSTEKWLAFSGLGIAMVTLAIGWVNTTFAHEHALISMFVIGLVISEYRKLDSKKVF